MTERDAASLLTGLLLLLHTFGAWAIVEVNMEDRVEVFRGETAQIGCMFQSPEGPGGTIIQWFYVKPPHVRQRIYYQDAIRHYMEQDTPFTDRISVNISADTGMAMLTINKVGLQDQLEYICVIKALTEGEGEGSTKLKVFETPNIPTIESAQTRISINEEGLSKIGTCEVKNGFPKPNITWYRGNTPLQDSHNVKDTVTTESSGLYSVSSELSMKVTKDDMNTYFYCEVTYFVPGAVKMMETKRINITVLYPSTAVNVWVESPKGKIKEGDSVELHCRGNGNTDAEITFTHKSIGSTWEGSMVVLTDVTRHDSGVYECTSMDMENFDAVTGDTTVFVNYLDEVVVKPQDGVIVPQGGKIEASCNAVSSLKTHTAWFKNKKQISQGNVLVLKDATFDTAGTYICVVTVPEIEGMKKNGTFRVNVQGPPDIKKPEVTEMEKSLEDTVDLTCNVRGFPAPKVMWTTSDGKVLETATQKETGEGVQSVVSFKVTSDITAFCNASNDFGADAVAFNIKAQTPDPPNRAQKEGRGVIIAVIIICILLLAILGSVLYFLYKKGKICGRSGKQDLTKEKSNKDNIVVEMKSDTEEAVLLGVNGEKQPPSD